jgi:hypothetical protein
MRPAGARRTNVVSAGDRCLREVEARWPDSRSVAWKPGTLNGRKGRCDYEDRAARISILAGGQCSEAGYIDADCSRPDSRNHLRTGRAIHSLSST